MFTFQIREETKMYKPRRIKIQNSIPTHISAVSLGKSIIKRNSVAEKKEQTNPTHL